ncbi:hypothetical protein GCM10020221_24730 [Streptomyces thioluteus]|uniref:D-alanyl-D-alanine carboxypeptidase n=1 Tax=Streptomyces thioluteus TaxID=66431 RepID=A0ABN3WTU8_STRTU
MIDEGRLDDSDHGPAARSADPAGDAARKFADLLGERGVRVDGPVEEGRAPASARRIAAVSSAPLAELVERALTNSDNDIAEALARQTALADGQPASFDGAGRAVTARLEKLGLPTGGLRDRGRQWSRPLRPRLRRPAGTPPGARVGRARPRVAPRPDRAAGGGVQRDAAGERYQEADGRGLVRAKTGTLTGVNTLAGTVVAADGRLLAFAFMADGTSDPEGAQRALDRLAVGVAAVR